ncbi:hypothetical protein V6N12_059270 [Hibiscus sabdariffa]|uniref:Uncharacterized protein n=1 Tax=Hibiscus sabdariffa TaxID=183260 RepID=A0ABR2EV32_9ROSI
MKLANRVRAFFKAKSSADTGSIWPIYFENSNKVLPVLASGANHLSAEPVSFNLLTGHYLLGSITNSEIDRADCVHIDSATTTSPSDATVSDKGSTVDHFLVEALQNPRHHLTSKFSSAFILDL